MKWNVEVYEYTLKGLKQKQWFRKWDAKGQSNTWDPNLQTIYHMFLWCLVLRFQCFFTSTNPLTWQSYLVSRLIRFSTEEFSKIPLDTNRRMLLNSLSFYRKQTRVLLPWYHRCANILWCWKKGCSCCENC